MGKSRLRGLNLKELEKVVQDMDEPSYRAVQLMQWIYQKGVVDFSMMTNFPQKLRERLHNIYTLEPMPLIRKQVSQKDGTTKYLLQLDDGALVEMVFLPQQYGNSVCVSSQVGCRMGCRFCASALAGIVRNLKAGEMFEQVWVIDQELKKEGKRVSHIVIMGMGEPLENLEEVLKFMDLLNSKYSLNISYRNMTISTCGLVPQIKRLAQENLPVTLAVSLHASDDDTRTMLMPINKKYPLDLLMEACRYYIQFTKRRITYEYALIKGINDSQEAAKKLVQLLKGQLCHVNIIPINPIEELGIKRSSYEDIKCFMKIIEDAGISATLRKEMGTDIDAACGQLRKRTIEEICGNLAK